MVRVCISGYFDPLHKGHLEYIAKAKALTLNSSETTSKDDDQTLVVIVNSDHQATLKKGKSFMKEGERMTILKALRDVDEVVLSCDKDRTVCETLKSLNPKPDLFCNGGDQTNHSIPEGPVCAALGIDLVDGLGAKIQSSSWLTGLNAVKK